MLWWTLRKLRSADASAKHRAIDALANRPSPEPEALAALVNLLSDSSADVADHAERALGRMGEAAVGALCAVLTSAVDLDVRRRAVSALGVVGDRRAVQAIEAIVANTSDHIRDHAVHTLTRCLLRRLPLHLVETPKETTRIVELIGEITDQVFLAEIVLDERRGLVPRVPCDCLLAATARIDDLDVLAKIAEKHRPSPSAGETHSPIQTLARQRSDRIARHQRLARGLGSSAPDDEAVVGALRNPDITVREAAAEELRERKWTPRTKDEHAWFYAGRRLWSSVADLGVDGGPALVAALESGTDSRRSELIRALGQTRDGRAFGQLARCTTSGDWETRKAAAHALGALGDSRAAEVLVPLLRDPYSELPPTKPWTPASAFGSPQPEKNYWTGESFVVYPVRRAAIDALVRLRPPDLVTILIALAVEGVDPERAVDALRRVIREHGRSLTSADLECLAALPRICRTETRETGYRDPEGTDSGTESFNVDIDCEELRNGARAELERRATDD